MKCISTVLLEYFVGEKFLQMSQISKKNVTLCDNHCVLTRIVHVHVTSRFCNLIIAK